MAVRDEQQRLIEAALASTLAYQRLAYLSDRIGHRLAGSKGLERAVAWATETMRRDGLDNVRAEPVRVPHWVRGRESAELVAPERRPLVMLGLGMSVGTGRGGITAPVLVVRDFDELKARAREVPGKIVLFNAPFAGYGTTVRYRTTGASEAARLGAVAALVRSVGPSSLRTPHTGTLRYADDAPKIPSAAITLEDAELLARMQARGETPTVRLKMDARERPDALSANVIGEVRGRETPDELVVIGGHLDSWDVGAGSNDDGGGVIVCWEAARLMKTLGLIPRRTVRVVLFTNEENGTRGGLDYRDKHARETHIAALEVDGGVGMPRGFGLSTKTPGGLERLRGIARPLAPIGADTITDGGGGTDIGPLGETGVPTLGLSNDMSVYWQVHHTPADTMDKIDPVALARCVAAVAALTYGIAESRERL
jgi:carboxypeptidase Q